MENHSPARVENPADWGTLAARAVDDVSRVIQGEIRLVEVRLRGAIQGQVENIFLTLAAVAVAVLGALCLVAALIGFLHQWMPYWQATGIVGLSFVIVAIVMRIVGRHSAQTGTETA
jgi:Putative Actinobacterial Holin-X, holin superfamily III